MINLNATPKDKSPLRPPTVATPRNGAWYIISVYIIASLFCLRNSLHYASQNQVRSPVSNSREVMHIRKLRSMLVPKAKDAGLRPQVRGFPTMLRVTLAALWL